MQKFSAYLLPVALLATLLTGCGNSGTKEESSIAPQPAPEAVETAEPDPEPEPEPETPAITEGSTELSFAFGMFGIELPVVAEVSANLGDGVSTEKYYIPDLDSVVYAGYAPLASYESTARVEFSNLASEAYALAGNEYAENDPEEYTLADGTLVRWQTGGGSATQNLFLEALSDNAGYYVCISINTKKLEQVGVSFLEDVAASFTINEEQEARYLAWETQQNDDGTFISADGSLQIQLREGWNLANVVTDGGIFMLEYDNSSLMLQLMRFDPVGAEETLDDNGAFLELYESYLAFIQMNPQYMGADWGERELVELPGLGVQACVTEVDAGGEEGIYGQQVGFVYNGYSYVGSFMWLKTMDAEHRAEMEEALLSLSPAWQPVV